MASPLQDHVPGPLGDRDDVGRRRLRVAAVRSLQQDGFPVSHAVLWKLNQLYLRLFNRRQKKVDVSEFDRIRFFICQTFYTCGL